MRHEEYKDKIKEVWGRKVKLLTKYTGSNDKISVRCKVHDKEFDIHATQLRQGKTRCPDCKERGTFEEELQIAFTKWYRNTYPDNLITCGAVFTNKNQSKKACMMGYTKGYPDLQLFHEGKIIFIEFKSKLGKLSKSQVEMKEKITSLGYKYYSEEAMKIFE